MNYPSGFESGRNWHSFSDEELDHSVGFFGVTMLSVRTLTHLEYCIVFTYINERWKLAAF